MLATGIKSIDDALSAFLLEGGKTLFAWDDLIWHAKVPFTTLEFPISALDLFSALAAGAMIRSVVRVRLHWFRLLVATWFLSVGGTTTLALFTGGRPRWWTNTAVVNAVLLGYWLSFHCPGDPFHRYIWSFKPVQRLVPFIKAATLSVSLTLHSAEKINTKHEGWAWKERAPAHTFFLASLLAGCGGGLIVEFLNLLALPRTTFTRPLVGSSISVMQALLGSFLYVFVLARPHEQTDDGASGSTGQEPRGWRSTPNVKERGCLLIFLSLIALFPPQKVNAFLQQTVMGRIPGWKSTLIPADIGKRSADSNGSSGNAVPAAASASGEIFGYSLDQQQHQQPHPTSNASSSASTSSSSSSAEDLMAAVMARPAVSRGRPLTPAVSNARDLTLASSNFSSSSSSSGKARGAASSSSSSSASSSAEAGGASSSSSSKQVQQVRLPVFPPFVDVNRRAPLQKRLASKSPAAPAAGSSNNSRRAQSKKRGSLAAAGADAAPSLPSSPFRALISTTVSSPSSSSPTEAQRRLDLTADQAAAPAGKSKKRAASSSTGAGGANHNNKNKKMASR